MYLQKLLVMTALDDEGEEGSPNSSAEIAQKSALASWSQWACRLGRDRPGSEGAPGPQSPRWHTRLGRAVRVCEAQVCICSATS